MKTPRLDRLDDERSALVAQWVGLIAWSMKKNPWAREALGDLAESIAAEALVDAARMYDPSKGKFNTFAVQVIWSQLQNEAPRDGVIRRKSGGEYGCPPIRPLSIDHRANKADKGIQIAAAVDDSASEADEREALARAIKRLKPRERTVIRLRFFKGQSLHEVGEKIGVTREGTRQIQIRAIARLKKLMTQKPNKGEQ